MLTPKTTLNIYNVNHILTKKNNNPKSTKTHFKQKNICIIEKKFVILHPKLVYIGDSRSLMCCFWCL